MIAVLFGCSTPPKAAPQEADTGSEGGPQTSVMTSSDNSTTLVGGDAESRDAESDDGFAEVGFFDHGDGGGGVDYECSVGAQNCPPGERCVPWVNDGGSSWNATRCSEIDPNPAQPGESCAMLGSPVSGIDSCEIGSMCWDVDPQTLTGHCVAMCQGSEREPLCDDPVQRCMRANDEALALCLDTCDPLAPACADAAACAPVHGEFFCIPTASGELGGNGDLCEFVNACDPGRVCAHPSSLPACASLGCCTMLCDTSDPDADLGCAIVDPHLSCLPFFGEGRRPGEQESVGLCAVSFDRERGPEVATNKLRARVLEPPRD